MIASRPAHTFQFRLNILKYFPFLARFDVIAKIAAIVTKKN